MMKEFSVVMNDVEQYSIWAVGEKLPAGWGAVEFTGSQEECLSHIGRVWTDMRPANLRAGWAAS